MNVNWNSAASAALWTNHQHQKQNVETTGSIANNNDPIFKSRNAETTGAVAMFNGIGGASQDGHFMAVA